LHLAEDPIAVQLQLAPVGVREGRERLMVARAGTDQSAVVHEQSLASRLTTTATPPMLEIRRRVSPASRVITATGKSVEGGSGAASRSQSSARHHSHRGPASRGHPEADDPPAARRPETSREETSRESGWSPPQVSRAL